ncbi:hypothetical protein [Tsukamurella paurometabola]|uniref:DNA gyrase subunit A n=1 Tax=Tsukamurella paurometabola TaxID=2061 RepID=A0A3P8MC79_TSUPA|nr:hypothetical protein [Tsukamurella paurometabola]UEA81801.1 hypothetical protein LK411_15590 [Tsukamurella paurometabola]VDR38816.1 DNA gyrase subunit A [Tsukamurella paurometabola]
MTGRDPWITLEQQRARRDILVAIAEAMDHHRDVLEIMFAADDIDGAVAELQARYGWTAHQAAAVTDLQWRRLPRVERERITTALGDLTAEIARVEAEQHNLREL